MAKDRSMRPVFTSNKPVFTSHKPVLTSHKLVFTSHKPVFTSHKPKVRKDGCELWKEIRFEVCVDGLGSIEERKQGLLV